MTLPSPSWNWGHHTSPYTFPMAVKASGVPSTPRLKTEGTLHGRTALIHRVKLCQLHSPNNFASTLNLPGGRGGLPPPPEPGIRKALALDPLDLADLCGFSLHSTPSNIDTYPNFTTVEHPQCSPAEGLWETSLLHTSENLALGSLIRTPLCGALWLCSCVAAQLSIA